MSGPFAVRISDGVTDLDVTRFVERGSLTWRNTAPGGHQGASCKLNLHAGTFTDLGPGAKLYIYDTCTGRTLWEGYIDNPGASAGSGSQSYDISATGGKGLLSDEHRALLYLDVATDGWGRIGVSFTAMPSTATAESASDPTAPTNPGYTTDPGVLLQFAPGAPVGPGQVAEAVYSLEGTDMDLGALAFVLKSGKNDTGYSTQVYTRPPAALGGGTFTTIRNDIVTSAGPAVLWAGDNIPAGQTAIGLLLTRTGPATNVADDSTWSFLSKLVVVGRRLTQDGTPVTGAAQLGSASSVLAHQVVADIFGRLLRFCDPVLSTISTGTTVPIEQLVYRDPVAAATVLEDLGLYEPDYLWEVLETAPGRGHRFNYRPWPTTPRYEISTRDGYSATGSDNDLCNRIVVGWVDADGTARSATCSSVVPQLGSRIKDADPVTLPEGLGSLANATRIGDQILAAKAAAATSAKATVFRRVYDYLTGTVVSPWELQTGYLVRVRELGVDLRLSEVEVSASERSADLTLGTPVLTAEQRVARLARNA